MNVQTAHNQSITTGTDAAYEVISVKPDYDYEIQPFKYKFRINNFVVTYIDQGRLRAEIIIIIQF